jgi:hypothetical protein
MQQVRLASAQHLLGRGKRREAAAKDSPPSRNRRLPESVPLRCSAPDTASQDTEREAAQRHPDPPQCTGDRPSRTQAGSHVGQRGLRGPVGMAGREQGPCGALLPLAGGDEPLDDLADLDRGERGHIRPGLQADSFQHGGPRGAASLRCGHDRIRPARDHLVLALAVAERVAEGPVRADVGVQPQPRPDVHDQPVGRTPPAAGSPANATQPGDIDPYPVNSFSSSTADRRSSAERSRGAGRLWP